MLTASWTSCIVGCFDAGPELGLVLAGGYALVAHDVVTRPSRDIDFATSAAVPMSDIVARLTSAYQAHGFDTQTVECTPRMARMVVTTGVATCDVDVLKEAIGPPALLKIGPVLAFDDAVGLKVRALHERAAHRDFVDIHAASAFLSAAELEKLGARHTPHFSLEDLADRLGGLSELGDAVFAEYGLDEPAIRRLRQWALRWETDIRSRLAAGESGPGGSLSEWDAYLDEA